MFEKFFEKHRNERAKRILWKEKFPALTNYLCKVMNSVLEVGLSEHSSAQAWTAFWWANKILRREYVRIQDKYGRSDELYDAYRVYRRRFDNVRDKVFDAVDEYNEKRLLLSDNEKPVVFAVDVDSVLRNNLGEMVKLYNSEFNENMTLEDVKNYKTDVSFPRIEEETGLTSSQWFFQDHSEELFVKAKPFEHAKEDIDELRKVGKVIIVTYQKTILNKVQTLEWLDNNGIKYDGIVFVKDKYVVDCDYFIDDNDWNFNNCMAAHGILINAPYNKNTDLDELKKNTKCQDITRYDSLHDFVLNLKNKQR